MKLILFMVFIQLPLLGIYVMHFLHSIKKTKGFESRVKLHFILPIQ
jgi:hypothetical protein